MKLRLLMMCVILPLLSLAGYFAAQPVLMEQEKLANARSASARLEGEALANDLIHAMQKERGYSAGFIGSGGENFVPQLGAQKDETDAKLSLFVRGVGLVAQDHPKAYETFTQDIQRLAATRSAIQNLDVSVGEMAGYYTGLINRLLTIAHPSIKAGSDATLEGLMLSRSFLSAAKERAGLERAMGSNGLGNGFSPAVYRNFLSHAGAQGALLDEIAQMGETKDPVADLYASEQFQELTKARETIVAMYSGTTDEVLTAPIWFGISTAWIEELRAQELAATASIDALAAVQEAESKSNLSETTMIGIIAVAVTAVLAVFTFERIIRRVRQLTDVIYGFAAGDFNVFIKNIDGKDELSRMAKAIYHFKQETLAMRREAEAIKDSDEAALNAKHGEVVALVTEGLAALAQSDLTCHFDQELDKDYDAIRVNFNDASSRLRTVLTSIANTVEELDRASSEMKASSMDLTARSQQQSETINETSSNVNALSVEVRSFGEDIDEGATLASNARNHAVRSGDLMNDAVKAMERISRSSEKINAITELIDDIAFQTNLLALNAGVEAARAGEAGRGFSVVASEVRALAQRAGDATREIKELVSESSVHVGNGEKLVNKTGEALVEIEHAITRVDDLLKRVSTDSQKQIGSLNDLALSMSNMNEISEKNSDMANDTRVSSEDIARRSRDLSDLICDFQLVAPDPKSQRPPTAA